MRRAVQAQTDEAATLDLRTRSARLRASVDPRALDAASTDARLANELIGRRTFSWTELYNRFETTVPDEAEISAVEGAVQRALGVLNRVLAIGHRDDPAFRPLLECQANIVSA